MTDVKEKARMFEEMLRYEGFRGGIALDAPLAPLTWYRIGGPARILVEAASTDDIRIVGKLLSEIPIPALVMGAGSNLLISDEGFPGIVIRLEGEFQNLDVVPEALSIVAGAAAPLAKVVHEGCRIGMNGMERLAGIPGSVGGALFMNAGTYGEYIDGLVESVETLTESNEIIIVPRDECGFAYRTSRFRNTDEIILRCTLIGEYGDPDILRAEVERRLEHRRNTQPIDALSCGCVFRNPGGGRSAGRLIDEAGLKGTRIGGAVISEKHANFFINEGGACAEDILRLMAIARKKVFELYGVRLEAEVRVAGFAEPLEAMLDARDKE